MYIVTAAMAYENMRRLHNLALEQLPPESQRPQVVKMSHVFSSLMRKGKTTFTVGYVSGKGFQRYSIHRECVLSLLQSIQNVFSVRMCALGTPIYAGCVLCENVFSLYFNLYRMFSLCKGFKRYST